MSDSSNSPSLTRTQWLICAVAAIGLLWIPAVAGGVFGLLGGYFTDRGTGESFAANVGGRMLGPPEKLPE